MSTPVAVDDEARWRGVAAESVETVDESGTVFLRARSRRLLGRLARPHARGLWAVAVAAVGQNLAGLAGPFLVAVGIDRGIPALVDGRAATLVVVAALLLASAVVQGVLRWYFVTRGGRISQDMLFVLRREVFAHLQAQSLAFHEQYTSGRVISRLTSDVDNISELLDDGIDQIVIAGLSVVSITVVLLFLDAPLALVALAAFPAFLALVLWFRRHSTVRYRQTREAVALLIVQFAESLAGIRAVQAFRREPRNQRLFERVDDDYKRANRGTWQLQAFFEPGVTLLSSLATGAVLLWGGWRVLQGDLQVGALVAFLLYLRQFFAPMEDLSVIYNTFQSAVAGLEKLSGVLEEPVGVAPPAVPTPLPHARGDIRLEAVRFGYRGGEDAAVVLPTLDLHIPAGQTVALVGATGAGKSTVARLVARFYDPQQGAVRLDGVDVRDLTDADLRRAVTMVTQESFLFTGSVADNIGLGDPRAGRDRIEAAARAIGADTFIRALPEGYDTDVRKRGGRLSAGQKQLVAFARAFLADPAILVLDEATSSLDVPSERLVQRALRTILADRTAVIIAHRLSTVEIADRVLVMSDGRVVEDGTPAELVQAAGRFAALHDSWRESLV